MVAMGRACGMPRIETRLGSTLVIRNTRHFGLSETGRLYYERALSIVADIDHLEEEISFTTSAPRGTLSIGAPVELGRRQIAPFIEAFSAKHPKLAINLALASEGIYDFSDSLDVVLRGNFVRFQRARRHIGPFGAQQADMPFCRNGAGCNRQFAIQEYGVGNSAYMPELEKNAPADIMHG